MSGTKVYCRTYLWICSLPFLVVRMMYSCKCYTVTLGWRCPSNGHFRIFWCSKHFPGSGYICWSWKNTSPFQVWLAMWTVAWENRRYFATPPSVSPQNVVLETSTEIPYWWRVTSQIGVVFLIGRAACEICFNQSEALPRSSDASSVWNFCTHFSDVILWENLGCIAECRLLS